MLTPDTLYVQIFADRLVATNAGTGETAEVRRDARSASPRMLVGDFTLAQQEMKEAVKAVRRGWRSPEILLHPMERIEGGITPIEARVLLELGAGAGASRVAVHTGPALSGLAVREAIRGAKG
ncbi:MAG: hypothetical protein N2544_16770 [Burkholderiales bacterium]|nr:hypothetical protein [Burkholderiales bacterium]